MAEMKKSDSNVKLIRSYFGLDKPGEAMAEMRKLTAEDKQELGDGIRELLPE